MSRAPEPLHRRLEQRDDLGLVGDVGGYHLDGGAQRPHLLGGVVQVVFAAGSDYQGGALFGEGPGDCLANPGARPGHNCDLSV